jgi:hypothetical protein
MTSATKSPGARVTREQTAQLLLWLRATQPKVYEGLVRRFTPAGVSGIYDSISGAISKVADGVTNFFNSQGGQALVSAATPFLQTSLEKKQLQLNIQRMQNGLPIQQYPGSQPDPFGNNSAYFPQTSQQGVAVPWLWLGVGGLALGFLLSRKR